jgi:moderate conductance mechanosensitive channel
LPLRVAVAYVMRRLLPLFITLLALSSVALPARSQSLPGIVAPSAAPSSPPGVRVEGIYQTAPVRLEGHTLFRIASLAGGSGISAEVRAGYIQDAFEEILARRSANPDSGTVFDPATFAVEVRPDGPQAVLSATDAVHHTPFAIMTVTTVDARVARIPVEAVAEEWRGILQTALVAALEKRQPAQVKKNTGDVLRVGAALVAITCLVLLLGRLARRRIADASKDTSPAAAAMEEPIAASQSVPFAVRVTGPEIRTSFWRAVSAFIVWALVLLWFAALVWGLSLFPQTASLGQDIGRRAVRILFIWILTALLLRALDVVIARVAAASRDHVRRRDVKDEEKARQLLRIPTIVRATHDTCWVSIVFAAGLIGLSALGLPIASVLTIGGLVVFALTFAAQNLVRDFLNGFLVLLEDQYVVGDYVRIGEWAGMVEHMTLRIVQIRDASGNLVTIPYGTTNAVVNASRYWSRIDYQIAIASDADAGKALDVMRETLERLTRDPQWRDAIVDPLEWAGVESVGSGGLLLRACVRTAPLRQFELRREINARVLAAFREAGITFGVAPDGVAT